MRQLVVWEQAYGSDTQITSHECRLVHPGSFTPKALY